MTPELEDIETEIGDYKIQYTFGLGRELSQARSAIPEGKEGDKLFTQWCKDCLPGINSTEAKRFIRFEEAFRNISGVSSKMPASTLFELSKKEYTPLIRQTAVNIQNDLDRELRKVDCVVLLNLSKAHHTKTPDELEELFRQLEFGVQNPSSNEVAQNAFKAVNQVASQNQSIALQYHDYKDLAPAHVRKKVENDMTDAITTWVNELPAECVQEILVAAQKKLCVNTTTVINI